MKPGRVLALLFLLIAGGLAAALALGLVRVPPAWDPFAPLDVKAPPNLVTDLKLWRLEHDSAACFAALESSDVDYRRLPDRRAGDGCDLVDTVRVQEAGVPFNRPFVATCPLAVSFAMFERHALQPAAERHFGRSVSRVEHLGSFACRNVYGREQGRRSQHATANALDVAAFILSDGRRIAIVSGWAGGTAPQTFLRDARDGACRFFDAVLSPDYNAAHRDHFHLDRGSFRACR